MTDIKLTRRGALLGAAGAGLTLSACSEQAVDSFAPGPDDALFQHGVASGDPDQTSFVVWTAITLPDEATDWTVEFELAADASFSNRPRGYTTRPFGQPWRTARLGEKTVAFVKMMVENLAPGEVYRYRFHLDRAGERTTSPVGISRTLPEGAVSDFAIGVFSCSNFPAGHFNVYGEAARHGELDLVLHLGDYIYEYGADGYATENAAALNRVPVPAHEILTYEDYVARHAQYRSDPDLQALHAAAPWIMTWDDHETTNNSWRDGAENHNEGEGDWAERRNQALRAYFDWTPTRERDDLRARFGAVEIGDLATLFVVESRLVARDEELSIDSFPVPSDADQNDPEVLAAVEAWKRDQVGDPQREMLGAVQIGEIAEAFAASKQDGKPWRILANQVIMGQVNFPDFSQEMPAWLRWYATRDNEFARNFIMRTRFDIPFNLDMWDGYPAERERLYEALKASDSDVLTLTGDVHSFWTNTLTARDGTAMGTEFVTASVTSPAPFSSFAAPGVDYGQMMTDANAGTHHCNMTDHGYIRLNLTPEAATADYIRVTSILSRNYLAESESSWRVTRTEDGGASPVERIA